MKGPKLGSLLILIVVLLGSAVSATAIPIAYEIKGVASGAIGGSPFTNALVIFTLTGNTNNVGPFPDFPVAVMNSGTTTVNIQGKGTATVTDGTDIFASIVAIDFDDDPGTPEKPAVFLVNAADTVLGVFVADSLLGYDLRSSFGPLTSFGGVGVNPGEIIHTTSGNLIFTSNASQATFTAGAVPEPSSLLLLGAGIVLLVGRLPRR